MNPKKLIIKVCGLTRPQDLRGLQDLGVDMTGFIFAAKSPRKITPEAAALMPQGKNLRVGVFVEQSAEDILRIMDQAALDLAQLHGAHGPDVCRAVGPERCVKVFWPAKYPSREAFLEDLKRYADLAKYFLFDAGTSGGGHGKSMDFNLVANLESPRPWLLAGGLGPDNIKDALAQTTPDGLDLNSALESSPGVKDLEKARRAFEIARR
jgi:phosphoribosylanthranilate isomerase